MAITKNLFGQPLEVGQLRYSREGTNNLALEIGKGTDFRITALNGWSSYTTQDGDLKHTGIGGDLIGRSLLNARHVDMTVVLKDGTNEQAIELERTFRPSELREFPLEFNTFTGGHRYIYCRTIGMDRPRHKNKRYHVYNFRLKATQPWIFSINDYSVMIELTQETPTVGFNLPLNALPYTFPLGTGTREGLLLNVRGSFDTYPVWTISGPSSGSTTESALTNRTTGVVFRYSGTLTPGQVLTFSTEALVTGRGRIITRFDGTQEISVYDNWDHPHRPLTLIPGINEIDFDVEGTRTGVKGTVVWKDIWI